MVDAGYRSSTMRGASVAVQMNYNSDVSAIQTGLLPRSKLAFADRVPKEYGGSIGV